MGVFAELAATAGTLMHLTNEPLAGSPRVPSCHMLHAGRKSCGTQVVDRLSPED